ncbi:5'-adenylylsulfate reductase-like 5 isoform X2 [Punica granatum]|uniref:5'-adenylylsulfate reductase-like 5 isoform X2 n=2 Tax=Punica granatum TaxID=22663 RepID=A0A6P8CI33_PUNGR|nr:5'-adenylylsulfate reductase-like 5 isoform X2 [Punica granatum]PKI34062.1 hypothetical protein CRG98_045519 [Punica granatum]
MASPAAATPFLFLFMAAFSAVRCVSSESPPLCPVESAPLLLPLQSQCPASISLNPHLQVDGDFLERVLSSKQQSGYTSVLFYASWCPFSQRLIPTYDVLSSMFPQIDHLAVEQSSAMPRYGIHSVPSIMLVSETLRVRYHGPKNFVSLVKFYERVTGLKPVQDIVDDEPMSPNRLAPKDMLEREPYLVFSILFICLRVLLMRLPGTLSWMKSFWVSYVPHFNLGILGETSQISSRVLHTIDVRRFWTKLRHCKTQNFHGGTKNARAWASSFASVSLGEPSSARSST